MKPQVPIEVNDVTGVWSTDGLPMLYVPRHFFMNNHRAVEAALGPQRYSDIIYDAGYTSARTWCEQEARTHSLAGMRVFEHYLARLSQRGWGQFSFITANAAAGEASIKLMHSVKNLQIGYSIPKGIASKIGLTNARVYVQGVNLFTVTKYSGIDPDVNSGNDRAYGVDQGNYPLVKTYTFGLNLGF